MATNNTNTNTNTTHDHKTQDNSLAAFDQDSGINTQMLSHANTRSRVNSARRHSVGKLELALERTIVGAQTQPLDFEETEEITVLGQRGIWLNRHEAERWRGPIPIDEYPINEDESPEVIEKVCESF
jgi:hypothetical protein